MISNVPPVLRICFLEVRFLSVTTEVEAGPFGAVDSRRLIGVDVLRVPVIEAGHSDRDPLSPRFDMSHRGHCESSEAGLAELKREGDSLIILILIPSAPPFPVTL